MSLVVPEFVPEISLRTVQSEGRAGLPLSTTSRREPAANCHLHCNRLFRLSRSDAAQSDGSGDRA